LISINFFSVLYSLSFFMEISFQLKNELTEFD
jgi:hypothetical protein